MANAEPTATIRIELVYAPAPRVLERAALTMPAGATVAEALQASGWLTRLGPELLSTLATGVWGRACEPGTPLREGDRVELYRPLTVDPKEARRQRYRRDGVRRAPRG